MTNRLGRIIGVLLLAFVCTAALAVTAAAGSSPQRVAADPFIGPDGPSAPSSRLLSKTRRGHRKGDDGSSDGKSDGKSGGKANKWKVPGDFATIQEAIDSPIVLDGDEISVQKGTHAGALVTKRVKIKGKGKGKDSTVIDFGPVHGSGLIQGFRLLSGSDGTEISDLTFRTDLAIMNGAAIDDVKVVHNTFENAIQAISNWRGSGWTIDHNDIKDLRTRCGGGIGILIADFTGGTVENNRVKHNKISGTLHVSTGDCGGYSGTGIVLFADFRWGGAGALSIEDNRVERNKVDLASDTPAVVDVVAFELTDTRDIDGTTVICNNVIERNDFKKTSNSIAITPASLEFCNTFSKNKEGKRSPRRGMRSLSPIPKVFGPDM